MPRITRTCHRTAPLVALALLVGGPRAATTQGVLPSLTDRDVSEVRAALTAMQADPRGPFLRIRWFCADSTVHPPQGTPCRERGGGVQYAERNAAAVRLDRLFFHTGTILQAVPFDSLVDAAHDHHWLKELVVQQYLFEVDDGWVYRRARYYRGARQIEDEEARGQDHLVRLLGDTAWVTRHYLLAARLVATMPHQAVTGDDLVSRIRNLATDLAMLDSSLMALRIKIHSYPSRDDLTAVDRRLGARTLGPEVRARLSELRELLRQQYDPTHAIATLEAYRRRLRSLVGDDLAALQRHYGAGRARDAFLAVAALAVKARDLATTRTDGRTALRLMDLQLALQDQAFALAQELAPQRAAPTSRRARLLDLLPYSDLAYGAGFLSRRERTVLVDSVRALAAADTVPALAYREAVAYVGRGVDWAWATVRSVFGPTHQRYVAVEPKAIGFQDALVRGSVLLPLAAALAHLGADADRTLGAAHILLGREVSQGVHGFNPGVARRLLEVPEHAHAGEDVVADRIYVLPSTTPELRPVAGVITLDEGNPLSHVQLLARNLGIPNAAVSSEYLPLLQAVAGREVFYAVTPLGRVVLKTSDLLTADELAVLAPRTSATPARIRLDVSALQLDRIAPVPMRELRADASGVTVGPKAANLGQLAAYFPDRVSAGVALPFGMFYRHVNRPFEGDRTPLEALEAAYRAAAEMRAAGATESDVDRYVFEALAQMRRAILELPWVPEVRAAIEQAVRETFPDVRRGVFVRSDTNVEDLPQFSGAGLNLTVPHRISVDGILEAVRRVWTSPFSERAYLWRRQILEEQSQVYPSVLLLESVHSEKSGVLITTGLDTGGADALTISTAEGVGGAVEGEQTETIVVQPGGAVALLSQTKGPVRRALVGSGSGGVVLVPAAQPDTLLRPAEIAQLQAIVREWRERFAPGAPDEVWDIEFGVVDGKVWLFQIRPFIRSRGADLVQRLAVLDREMRANANRSVALEEEL